MTRPCPLGSAPDRCKPMASRSRLMPSASRMVNCFAPHTPGRSTDHNMPCQVCQSIAALTRSCFFCSAPQQVQTADEHITFTAVRINGGKLSHPTPCRCKQLTNTSHLPQSASRTALASWSRRSVTSAAPATSACACGWSRPSSSALSSSLWQRRCDRCTVT